jgi:hypothetical protein
LGRIKVEEKDWMKYMGKKTGEAENSERMYTIIIYFTHCRGSLRV